MIIKNIFFSFLILKVSFGFTQNIDSLKNLLIDNNNDIKSSILIELINVYEYTTPDSCLKYSNELLSTSKKTDDLKNEAFAYSRIGKSNHYLGKYENAYNAYQSSLELYKKINNQKGVAEQLNSIGVYYNYALDDYDKALDYYFKSLKIREEIKDTVGIAYSLNNVAHIFYNQNQRDKAIEYYLKALDYAKQTNDKKILSIIIKNLGVEFAYKSDYQKALQYHFKAVKIEKELNNKLSLGISYISIGSIYNRINKHKTAFEYYTNALKIFDELANKYYKSLTMNYIAGVFEEENNYDSAIVYLNSALEIAYKIKAQKIIENSYKELSEIYAKKHSYFNAYQYQQKYIELHDNLYSKESDKRLKEMNVKYETVKTEKENETLKHEKQIQDIKMEKQTNLRNFLILFLVLLFFLAILIYNRYRFKQKTNKILEEKNTQLETTNKKLYDSEINLKNHIETKDKFFSIIAHDLRNPLSSLALVSEMLDNNLNRLSKEKQEHYISSISNSSNNLLNLVENLLDWARTQTDKINYSPEKVDISQIVNQNIELLKINAEKRNITLKSYINKKIIVYVDINMIMAVIRNLLINAIKFSNKNGEVSVSVIDKNDFIEIIIKDNGIGISYEDQNKLFKIDIDTNSIGTSSEKGTGLGLILCKEFVEKNDGKIRIESEIGKGSSFIFTLKKLEVTKL
ncbi:MAG: tetratricopeptide repeat-containing sensor histidine kinase [Bacteroidales bacterium]|nr:tetratricopeptide repeat-containing sensor histidine kinase [Bacteroidales bacterium]